MDYFNNIIALVLQNSYTRLFCIPRPQGIILLFLIAGFLMTLSVILWCILFSTFLGEPLFILKADSVYDFTVHTVTTWIDLYRRAWLASAAEYGFHHDFGPIPAYILYLNTLKYSSLYYPNIVVFNLLLVLYMVLFGHCFGVMLHGLITQKPKVAFKINPWHIAFRMLMLTIILILFVWCPPVFGPGVPANFETGDPLNPIDWSKIDCVKSNSLLTFLSTYFSTSLPDKKLPRSSEGLPRTNTKKIFLLLVLALLAAIAICYIYYYHPECIHQAWDCIHTSLYKATSFICRVLLGALKQLIKQVIPNKASCHDPNEEASASSSSNKSSSWFNWGSKGSSSSKKETFTEKMVNKGQAQYEGCGKELKQNLHNIDNQPLTPRRDAMRKSHAWEKYGTCNAAANAYFEALKGLSKDYLNEQQPHPTSSTYSASFDIQNKKVEVKYQSDK